MKINVGNKDLTIRKWKGKDKKQFIQQLNADDIPEQDILNTLVYNCIEEDVILSLDEIKYILTRIRIDSLGDTLNFTFKCGKCEEYFDTEFKISDLITYSYKKLDEIKVKNHKIKISEPKNKEIYNKYMTDEDYEIYDFLLRIDKIDQKDTFTLEELIQWFDDLDLDISEKIIEEWNKSKFTIKDTNTVTCTCGAEETYKFDELPEFFPSSWFK